MASATSLAPIEIEDEGMMLTIKNLSNCSNLTLMVELFCVDCYLATQDNIDSNWYYDMYEDYFSIDIIL